MGIVYVNTGTAPNQRNGDTLRTAFQKINANLSYLESLYGTSTQASVVGDALTDNSQHTGITASYSTITQKVSLTVATPSLVNGIYDATLDDYGRIFGPYEIHTGGAYDGTDYSGTSFRADLDENRLVHVMLNNFNTGANATAAYVAMNSAGDLDTNLIKLGINSTGYSYAARNATAGGDGYLSINNGDLVIGTETTGKNIKFHVGGTTTSDIVGTVSTQTWSIRGDLVPVTNATSDLGSSSFAWDNLFINSLKFADGTTQTTAFKLLSQVPASSTSTGIQGQIAVDSTAMYVCVATNSWLKFTGVTF